MLKYKNQQRGKKMQNIEKVIDFMIEIEKLKDILRKTKPVGLNRFENSAEHSWHVCISALMLKEYSNEKVNIDKVIKMLLIHDLGEIDAGDTVVYHSDNKEVVKKEMKGIKRILDMLGEDESNYYFDLWNEFEKGETAEAKFARAVDRVPPLLHNLHGEGHSWKSYNVPKEKVFSLNKERINEGSETLWNCMEKKLHQAVSDGILK